MNAVCKKFPVAALAVKGAFCLLGVLSGQHTLWAHPGANAALTYYSRAVQDKPADQELYIQRGIVYSNDSQYQLALADFKRAETLGNPTVVAFDLGVLYYRMSDFDKARRYFDDVLHLIPNHTQSLEYRARLLRDSGDYPAAIRDFQRVFELQDRPNPGHYISVVQMLISAGPEGVDQALLVIDAGNKKLGLTPQLQRRAIELEMARGQSNKAVQRLWTLQPMLGESPDWKVDMGDLMLQIGQPEQAAALLEEASLQLSTLRRTPARMDLQQRIDHLRERD